MAKDLSILIVSPRYYPHVGGVEYVVKSITERLAKMGYDVIVLAGEPRAEKPYEEMINEVRVIRWPTWAPGDAYHIPKMKNRLESTLKELIRDADVVHIHSAHAILPVHIGIKMKELKSDARLIFTLHYHAHGHTLTRELAWRTLWRKYVRKLVRYADKIHAISSVEAERITNHYPEARDKLIIIPNGIEEDVLQYKWKGQNSDYIMYAGRIEKYKRLEVAVDLIAELNRRGHYLRLLIVGQGSHLPKLKQYVQNKARNKVEFMSPLPRKDYLGFIANALAVINPSHHEAFSIFIAESLAIGTPAIVSCTIAKIYKQVKTEPSPFLIELQPILSKYKLTILANDNRKIIKTWDNIVKDLLCGVYLDASI